MLEQCCGGQGGALGAGIFEGRGGWAVPSRVTGGGGEEGAAAEGARGAAMGRTPPARRPEGGGWGFLPASDKRKMMTSPARGKTSHRFISVS